MRCFRKVGAENNCFSSTSCSIKKLNCAKFHLLVYDNDRLSTKTFELINLDESKDDDFIKMNYNDDFIPHYELIYSKLCTHNEKGLVILHGLPGSGKTSLIKQLAKKIPDKRFIFITPQTSNLLGSPSFISYLLEVPNSVLILEDAESILMSNNNSSAISNLLNITDGLLSDVLNIQLIITFNIEVELANFSFIRAARLIDKFCFGPLTQEKTTNLLKQLGHQNERNESLTLSDIYNYEDVLDLKEEQKLGYKY